MDAAPANIDDYIAAQASAVQPILRRIRAIVREEAPDAQEAISYRIPAFMQGGVLLYFAAFKKHIHRRRLAAHARRGPRRGMSQAQLAQDHQLPSVLANLLARHDEARSHWLRAAERIRNARESELQLEHAHNTLPEGGKS